MIVHLVLFKFKPGVVAANPQVADAVSGLESLPARVPGIRGWEHGPNLTEDAQAWDYGLRALFDDERAMQEYFDHPEHLAVAAKWEALSELVFCDFRI